MNDTSGKFDHDVIIVGGGPAGVSCAIAVAQKGYDVVILDKKRRNKIGDKTCGDAIDRGAVQRMYDRIGVALPHDDEVSDPISKMSLAADEIDLKVTLDAPGFQVNRLIYGQRLLEEAETAGVTIIDSAPVRGILTDHIDGETYLTGVKYFHKGQELELRAKFTIDASGAYAAIRRELPNEFLLDGITRELSDDELWPTYREIIQLDEAIAQHPWPEEIVLMFDADYPPPGYFWVFTEGEGYLNFGIGWEKTQDLGKLKERLKDEMALYYSEDQYKVIKRGGGQIPFRPPFDSLIFNGGALAGDAACMVHPVTAEGHGPALDTGSILGTVLISALEQNRRDRDSLWDYNIQVAHHYGKKHMEAHMMKELLRNIGANGLKYMIQREIFTEEELNLIFSGGDINNVMGMFGMIKRVVKLLPRPKILLGLFKVINRSNKIADLYQNYPTTHAELETWRRRRNESLGVSF